MLQATQKQNTNKNMNLLVYVFFVRMTMSNNTEPCTLRSFTMIQTLKENDFLTQCFEKRFTAVYFISYRFIDVYIFTFVLNSMILPFYCCWFSKIWTSTFIFNIQIYRCARISACAHVFQIDRLLAILQLVSFCSCLLGPGIVQQCTCTTRLATTCKCIIINVSFHSF